MIHVDGISRVFRSRRSRSNGDGPRRELVQALDSVRLDVGSGEVFGLVGMNGAGKTTLVKILSTLLLPTSGTASVDGYDILTQDREARARIGLSAENERAFYWRLSGRQNLEFFGALQGLGSAENSSRVESLLRQVGLSDAAEKRFMEYSTGMKRKLSFARALLLDPPVLILDEPTSNIDPVSAEQLREQIRDLRDNGRTILLTSHNMFEVERLATRVGIIHQGRLVATDEVGALRSALGHSVVTLSFAGAGLNAGELEALPGVSRVQVADPAMRIITSRGPEMLNALVALTSERRLQLAALSMDQPTLEDVFFEMAQRPCATEGTPGV